MLTVYPIHSFLILSIIKQQPTSSRRCRCGSTTHLRTSFRGCPLNDANQDTVRRSVRARTNVNAQAVREISKIGSIHLHVTILYFLKEPAATPQPEAAPAIAPSVCSSCGAPGHLRSTFATCPFNRRNVESEHGPQYQTACIVPFVPEQIMGPNICYTPGISYRRHVLPRMDRTCSHCDAQMWVDERLANSSVTTPMFGMCCTHGKINLPIPRPPPAELLAILTDHNPSNETSALFHTNIRAYNSAFAFASIQANYD